MRDTVDILKYWIKELRRVIEFQEIAKVENIEFLRLYGETQRTLNNMFIEYADEYGVKRLEKIAGIYPESTDTLEQRKARLYVYWNDKGPYTERELRNRLENLCGSGKFEIEPEYKDFLIHIYTHVGGYGIFDEVTKLLDYFLPANLILDLQNILKGESTAGIYCGVGSSTAISYTVTNDVNAEYGQELNLFTGVPLVMAQETLVTNDINSSYGMSLSLNQAVAPVHATETQITNDINSENELNEDKTIANVVSTSQVITI